MPQTQRRVTSTSPSGQQARLGYVPERVLSGGDAEVSGSAGNRTLTVNEQLLLDRIGATQGDVLFRGKTAWQALAPDTSGKFLTTQGAAADVKWTAGNSGTVTSVAISTPNSTMTVGGGPVTGAGTLTVDLKDRSLTATSFGDSTHVAVVAIDKYGVMTKDPVATAIAFPPVGVAHVTFGTGAPGGTPAEGDLYFDTTIAVYVGYVGHSSAWHQF